MRLQDRISLAVGLACLAGASLATVAAPIVRRIIDRIGNVR